MAALPRQHESSSYDMTRNQLLFPAFQPAQPTARPLFTSLRFSTQFNSTHSIPCVHPSVYPNLSTITCVLVYLSYFCTTTLPQPPPTPNPRQPSILYTDAAPPPLFSDANANIFNTLLFGTPPTLQFSPSPTYLPLPSSSPLITHH